MILARKLAMSRMTGSLSFVWLLMAIHATMAQSPPVLDTDGQPLEINVEYYVLPAATDIAGGLTLVERNASCPLYVGQEALTTVVPEGLPVVFTPRAPGETIITEFSDFTIQFFFITIEPCPGPDTWSIGEEDEETSRRFIVTGSEEPDYFRIERNELGLYTLGWCPACFDPVCPRPRCGFAGILEKNGTRFLALDGPAFPFVFRRGLNITSAFNLK